MRALKKYGITLGIGLLGVLGIAWAMDLFQQTHPVGVLRVLCDAFFAVGAVLTGTGALVFVSNEGLFDMGVYGVKTLVGMFRRNSVKKYASFYDYRAAREERKSSFGFLVVCGVAFLAVALVLYYCYSRY